MESPLISLIIPMYNAEKFIAECLDSAIAQTYKNLEIIVVDDDSKDDSAKIVQSYVQKNIRYVKTKNGNAAKTRRDGIEKATANLVCFVDADDVLDEKYVEYLYYAMKKTGTSLSACNIELFSGKYIANENHKLPKVSTLESSAASFADHYHISDTNKLTLQTLPCKLFNKTLFENIDYSVLQTNIFEDNFIMAQILRKVEKIGVVDRALYWYRQGAGTTSANTVLTTVQYGGVELNSVEFFNDIVMPYCIKMLPGPNVGPAIDRLRAAEFFNYAKMIPNFMAHTKHLEEKLRLEEDILKAREDQVEAILGSTSYRIGRAITNPAGKIVSIVKGRKQ